MKPSLIDERTAAGMIFSAKEDRGGKDAMKPLYDSMVMTAIFGEAEEIKDLGGTVETNDPAFLLNGECRYPDGNQTVLAEGESKVRMAGDIEKKSSVTPPVNELRDGRATEWNAAEDEGSGVKGELLYAVLAFFADESDGLKLAKPEL
jgi:hypothetical protein